MPKRVTRESGTPKNKLRVALAQIAPKLGDVQANLKMHLTFIRKARAHKADLIVFPELSLSGYLLKDMVPRVALKLDTPEIKELLAESKSIAIAVGLVEETPESLYFNSALFLEKGEMVYCHRKVYLPTYGMFDEGRFFGAGEALRAFDTRAGRFGVLICEEAWHSFCPYLLTLDGAGIIINMANSTARGLDGKKRVGTAQTWELMNRFYAGMHQVFFIFCNRVGFEDGIGFWGGSEVVDPFGKVAAKAVYFREQLVFADIDLGCVEQARLRTPLLRDEKLDFSLSELARVRDQRQLPVA
jgi:predicted amidohydrolase